LQDILMSVYAAAAAPAPRATTVQFFKAERTAVRKGGGGEGTHRG